MLLYLASFQPNLGAIATDAGFGLNAAAFLVSTMSVGSAMGAVIMGWLADRFEPRLIYASIAATMAAAVAALLIEPQILYIAVGLIGLASGGALPLVGVLVLRRFGSTDFPRVHGLLAPFMVPAFLGSVATGALRDATGSYNLALILMALLLAPGTAAVWGLRLTAAKRAEDLTPA
jgi:MFS family permease